MTDEQFKELMDKLTELENEIQKTIDGKYKSSVGKESIKTAKTEFNLNVSGEVKSCVEILEERIN